MYCFRFTAEEVDSILSRDQMLASFHGGTELDVDVE